MIKVKFIQPDIHRNETTFRPIIAASNTLREVGIELTNSDTYDFAIVGHASITNKKVSLEQSVNDGLKFLDSISGDYIIFDGQDSTSLIGTADVYRQSNAVMFLKINYLKNKQLYKNYYIGGRYYWGTGGNYNVPDIDKLSERMYLSGTNWVNTFCTDGNFPVYDYKHLKKYDVSAMFQYPLHTTVYEHGINQTEHYNIHRMKLINVLDTKKYNIAKLHNGERVTEHEYYQKMFDSKIILAPYGFGELPPRDIQAAQFGSILIKPDVSYVDTTPNIYVNNETYIACKHDFSDLEEKIDYVLSNFKELQPYIVENMRRKFVTEYSHKKLAMHLYNTFIKLNSITTI